MRTGPTERVVGLEVLPTLVKISLCIAFEPTGLLLTWLMRGRFGTRTTFWLSLRKKKMGFYLDLLDLGAWA